MPQIGPLEILVVGVLALLVFGPEKLPEMGRSIGKGLTQLKRMASDVKSDFDMGLDEKDEVEVAASPSPKPAPVTEADVPPAAGRPNDEAPIPVTRL